MPILRMGGYPIVKHDSEIIMNDIFLYDWFDCGHGFLKDEEYKKCPVCGAQPQSAIVLALRSVKS